ncbi:hypothetical protein HN695_05045 [Candidatus Woesearchaeota archaeon]|jgi:hypothetical protein|nr:hypothetical protein [Candidatus Woesearchaeota archaeon]MBT5272090.1 hypothetical protein [Candidatus Woesearchaeota archaeon]MBT6041840.1 hypothetical protein [Candidatus Woesearchaeota archaeon]MBT6336785.1 hypothetical protein [Candidatus Woesearchaeota archaeon]MBT7927680.1 hypothetical protein [Candidatus Woesearchaeota archaeon]
MKKRAIFAIIIISLLFLAACTITEDLAGEARKVFQKNKLGTKLVIEIHKSTDGTREIVSAYSIKYDKEQEKIFEKIKEDNEMELSIKQNEKTIKRSYSEKTLWISESLKDDGTYELGEAKIVDKGMIRVYIPIKNINLRKPLEISSRDLKSGKITKLIKKEDHKKWNNILKYGKFPKPKISKELLVPDKKIDSIKKSSGRRNLAGKATEVKSELIVECNGKSLKEIYPGHNNPGDKSRTDVIIVGYGYPEKKIFEDSLKYYISRDGEEFIQEIDGDCEGMVCKKGTKGLIITERVYNGIFAYTPFAGNAHKFNFWYDTNIYDLGIKTNNPEESCVCANSPETTLGKTIKKASEIMYETVTGVDLETLPYTCQMTDTKVIALCYDYCRGNAALDGFITQLDTKPKVQDNQNLESYDFEPSSIQMTVHEWGHLYGGLIDEYTEEGKDDKISKPNCANSESQLMSWWQDIFPGISFYMGCAYSEDNFRPHYLTIMREFSDTFGLVNEYFMCKKIAQKTGGAGPGCYKVLSPIEDDCGDEEDNDLDGKTDCEEIECNGKKTKNNKVCCTNDEICGGKSSCNDDLICIETDCYDDNGKIDCADPECVGQGNNEGYCCQNFDDCVDNFEIKKVFGNLYPWGLNCINNICRETYCYDKLSGSSVDNDGDGKANCADPDCVGQENNDGYCCQNFNDCVHNSEIKKVFGNLDPWGLNCINNICRETSCSDKSGRKSVDNDGDGYADCDDSDCFNSEECDVKTPHDIKTTQEILKTDIKKVPGRVQ